MFFVAIAFIMLYSSCDGVSYRNYLLVHGIPKDPNELQFFNALRKEYNVTFWRKPGRVNDPVEFSLSIDSYNNLLLDTSATRLQFVTRLNDIQSAFDQAQKPFFKHSTYSYGFENYYSLEDIYNWYKDIAREYPDKVDLLKIGTSFEKRDIFAVHLKLNKSNNTHTSTINATKQNVTDRHIPKVMIEGGCHGREWISPAVVTYIIDALMNADVSNNYELKQLAPMFDWFFVPVMNPDGYVYSYKKDRLWSKNRRDDYSVNLNRNFGVLFGEKGAVANMNDEEYGGERAFSEPESAAMAGFAENNTLNLEYYISFHSYGQYIILPYSFSTTHEDNYDVTKKLADLMAERILCKYNYSYKVGNSYETQGNVASGVSADWVKRVLNVTHVVTIQLPDAGEYGFALPSTRILITCQSILDGLFVFLNPLDLDQEGNETEHEITRRGNTILDWVGGRKINGATVNRVSKNVFILGVVIICLL